MKPRARRQRYILRRRRAGAVVLPRARSLMAGIRARQGASPAWEQAPEPLSAAARRALAFQLYGIADGMAYVPHNPAPPPQGTFVVPSGLPALNAAYWVGEDVADAPRDPVELAERIEADLDASRQITQEHFGGHTFDGECPECGPCEAINGGTELVNGVPLSDGCCLCQQEDQEEEDQWS